MGSDNEAKKKDKKDKDEKKDKHKDKGKDEKKDKHKDKDKDEKKDKHKDEKKDKHKDEKGKDKDEKDKDKHKGEKDKHKDEKDKDKHKDEKKKDKEKDKNKDKKDKDKKEKDKKDKPSHPPEVKVSSGPSHGGEAASFLNPSGAPSKPPQPAHPSQSGEVPWFLREPDTEPVPNQPPRTGPSFPDPNPQHPYQQPPVHQPARAIGDLGGGQSAHNVPPSGHRIALDPNAQFPSPDKLGRPPTTDVDGLTPVFIGSAILSDAVLPCKIVPSLYPPCRVPHGGRELEHHGRYDLLPITPDMEWVPTKSGQIPPGRRPVEGGYESNGGKLYHALGFIQGVYVPGRTGEHLGGANIPFRGSEQTLLENYSILCWR